MSKYWIPIKINPLFLVLIFTIGWLNAPYSIPHIFIWAGVAFLSVLVHEWGHAWTAVLFGQNAQIELFGLGGVTYREGPPLKLWKEFIIVLNGPLAGLFLAFLSFFFLYNPSTGIFGGSSGNLGHYALEVAFAVNVFWTFINLLPVHPLDGGHLMRIIFEGVMGYRGVKYSFLASLVFACLGSLFFFTQGFYLAGAIFFLFAFESYRSWKSVQGLSEQDRDEGLQNTFKKAEEEFIQGSREGAYEKFELIREKSKEGILYIAASEYMAEILTRDGRYQKAYELIKPLESKLGLASLRLLHQLSYRLGHWDETVRLGARVYQESPDSEIAVLNALSHAVRGEVEPTIGWLKTAISEGIPNVAELLSKREFDHIRGEPSFQELYTS